ncbi:MAG: HlyD family type I secretion periplasmic adaptor subunit [Alphaproteobacteria bacterium]|nr:HlyD family type I secretion periplasmic adaptor subunit [Alphaproteobacteria bacterium]MCD8520418.1 HlyD family type I secretion periplasmic adaptor subunit [Alphaproteobacteria bacterium]
MNAPTPQKKLTPEQQKQAQKMGEQMQKKMQEAQSINQEKQWANVRAKWAKEKADLAEAKAMAMLEVEDDLPLSKHMLLLFIFLFFAIFIIWANLAPLDEVTRGEGKVIPSTEVQALQSLDAGIVEEFLVKEGQEVEAGQVLVRLSDIEASSDLGANNARYLGLMASITRLQAEAEGKSTVTFPDEVMKGAPSSVTEEMNAFRANQLSLQNQLNILEQQRAQREQEVRELETRISDTRGTVRLQQQEMEMVRPLVEKGSAPKMELLQLERSIQEKNTELNGYLSSLPRAKSAIGEVRARIADIRSTAKAQAQTELAAKQIELSEIGERLGALKDRKTRTEIKSPVNGTIQDITVNTVGGVVRPGEDFIKIVPKDDQLIVEAKVKPSDRAFIYPGQKAVIKITAYDYSIYGGLEGELVDISADTFEDEKQNTYYKVKLRTYETEIKHDQETLPITIGMVASVDILTGKKTVMQYILKPLIKTLGDAMNER